MPADDDQKRRTDAYEIDLAGVGWLGLCLLRLVLVEIHGLRSVMAPPCASLCCKSRAKVRLMQRSTPYVQAHCHIATHLGRHYAVHPLKAVASRSVVLKPGWLILAC